MARSKWKWTSITTVPDLCPTTVKSLTHLISRYQLPLKTYIFYHTGEQWNSRAKWFPEVDNFTYKWYIWITCAATAVQTSESQCRTVVGTGQWNTVQDSAEQCIVVKHSAGQCSPVKHSAEHCWAVNHSTGQCRTLLGSEAHCRTVKHSAGQ